MPTNVIFILIVQSTIFWCNWFTKLDIYVLSTQNIQDNQFFASLQQTSSAFHFYKCSTILNVSKSTKILIGK
jgi:hypothetical protein